MRERLAGRGPSKDKTVSSTCPHLGLAEDPFNHLPEPSAEHRCYLWMQRERIDIAHQQRFCLTSNHPNCPWLTIAPAEPSTSRIGESWRRLSVSLRERFDHLEHATMRASWPRAMVEVGVFVAQMSAQALGEARRVLGPTLRNGVDSGRRLVAPVVRGRLSQKPVSSSAEAPTSSATAAVANESPNLRVEAGTMPTTSSAHAPQGDQPTPRSGRGRRTRSRVKDAALAARRWECVNCQMYNLATAIICQHCGSLSPAVEEDLLVNEEFLVLDGIRALKSGDEETAHRFFVLATENDAESEAAWYWRARTAATLDEIIVCLEQMLRLDPENERARRDLQIAQARREHQEAITAARRKAEARQVAPKKTGPTLGRRMLDFGRRLALETASIPSFALAIFLAGKYLIEALQSVGVQGFESVIPVFRLPTLTLALPADLTEPLLPSTVNVTEVAVVVLAVWYLWLAFQLADGIPSMRYWGIAGGLLALGALPFISASGRWFLVAAALLLALALVGKGSRLNYETYGSVATSGAS